MGAESVTVIKLQSFKGLGVAVAKLQSCKNFVPKRTHPALLDFLSMENSTWFNFKIGEIFPNFAFNFP